MGLMWSFAEVTNRQYWKAMSWSMLPSLAAAMCAVTWHLHYNAPDLEVWLHGFMRCAPAQDGLFFFLFLSDMELSICNAC
jgi:hypothetical protein